MIFVLRTQDPQLKSIFYLYWCCYLCKQKALSLSSSYLYMRHDSLFIAKNKGWNCVNRPITVSAIKQECIPVGCVPPAQWPSGGVSAPGGVSVPRGVSALEGCLTWGVWPGGSDLGGVPCDLSHHTFDVTCMLPPHQLRHINSAPAAWSCDLQGMLGYPPCEQNDRQV